ncbi:hypothetical protein GCM10010983_42270 [Caulobacter rhizosphaerae]|nr:hypothetical protein GCM10010983_42270 [Caulobacter rhizosphaerae]
MRLGILRATGGTGGDWVMRVSETAALGLKADTDVMTAAALVIILRRFMVRFSPVMRQNANLCALTTLVKLALA